MRKLFLGLFLAVFSFFIFSKSVSAQGYQVEEFDSNIVINQDTSLTVTETIKVNFLENRHGIYRYIPVVYRADGRVINSRFNLISVVNGSGDKYKYTTNRSGDDIQIKIGDADTYISGEHTYVITYKVRKILQRFDGHDELYWNVAGGDWDTSLVKVQASVESEFADVINTKCFANCTIQTNQNRASFISSNELGNGEDVTIVVALNKANQLNFSPTLADQVYDNWGYVLCLLPIIALAFLWFKRGRDEKYVGDNVYFKPDKHQTESVSVFRREFLPMVYSPINDLTPAEVGTLVDERVDTKDVVAEIVELGRLGHLKIEKIIKKLAPDDYKLTKHKKDESGLREYQKYLLESLFSFDEGGNEVLLSELKRKFYTKLNIFKEKVNKHMHEQKYFYGNPNTTRAIWIGISTVVLAASFFGLIFFALNTGNLLPFFILLASAPAVLVFAYQMPRKTAWGYALFRQTKGLAFYLRYGKWRQEVNEKHLFLEEMLPLAISLGVVNQLARDMDKLGVKPPSYFNTHSVVWASSFNSFSTVASSSLVTGASSSSGWSGGSGFSGGGGGGFGGGGGGSW